jgi:hypothetical protein
VICLWQLKPVSFSQELPTANTLGLISLILTPPSSLDTDDHLLAQSQMLIISRIFGVLGKINVTHEQTWETYQDNEMVLWDVRPVTGLSKVKGHHTRQTAAGQRSPENSPENKAWNVALTQARWPRQKQ